VGRARGIEAGADRGRCVAAALRARHPLLVDSRLPTRCICSIPAYPPVAAGEQIAGDGGRRGTEPGLTSG
jgi:hypothetical protein